MSDRSALRTPLLLSFPAGLLFLLLLLVPLAMVAMLSFQIYDFRTGISSGLTLGNYAEAIRDPYYQTIFLRTLFIAFATTLICVLIGAPQAYILSRMQPPWRTIVLILILSPLLVSVVVRTLGWAMLFSRRGLINTGLQSLGLTDAAIPLLYTTHGVIIALVHVSAPFMVIAVWASLQRIDPKVSQAAISLGARQHTVFLRVILPQILPGILSGSLIVFAISASAFATPAIIGGRQIKVVATTTYDEFIGTLNWPLGAALAICLLVVNVVVMLGYNRIVEARYARYTR